MHFLTQFYILVLILRAISSIVNAQNVCGNFHVDGERDRGLQEQC